MITHYNKQKELGDRARIFIHNLLLTVVAVYGTKRADDVIYDTGTIKLHSLYAVLKPIPLALVEYRMGKSVLH